MVQMVSRVVGVFI